MLRSNNPALSTSDHELSTVGPAVIEVLGTAHAGQRRRRSARSGSPGVASSPPSSSAAAPTTAVLSLGVLGGAQRCDIAAQCPTAALSVRTVKLQASVKLSARTKLQARIKGATSVDGPARDKARPGVLLHGRLLALSPSTTNC